MNLGFVGDIFTWSNRRLCADTVWERLDRACASNTWIQKFPFSRVVHLETTNSDHNPICVQIRDKPISREFKAPRRFRFEAMWLKSNDCKRIVEESWIAQFTSDNNSVWNRLDICSEELMIWSLTNFGAVNKRIKKLKEEIGSLRRGFRSEITRSKEENLTNELEELLDREDLMWRQRAKAHWFKEGDKNTRFFHGYASGRKKKNAIKGLMGNNGQWCETTEEIESIIVDYFRSIFTSSRPSDEDIKLVTGALDRRVDQRMNQRLLQRYTADEVSFALSCMHPLKSPGPDGFPVLFYQKFWSTVKNDVIKCTLDFLNKGKFHHPSNFTHIVLIPKCDNPTLVSQFRPISLCNVIYKLASKVIANRLKPIMNDIISDSQSAFVPSRLITDNILAAYEISHFMKNKTDGNKSFMALKLDLSKAYDRVEWPFLRESMLALGFDVKFVELIMICVTTVTYSFLINGNQLGFVVPERGIRQGDPLSPYLFLFCAESLSAMIKHEEVNQNIEGISICSGAPVVSHLLFADDTLIFARANGDTAQCIKRILHNYGRGSGQEINFDKSNIVFSRNTEEVESLRILSHLPMKVEEKHEKYLGLPMIIGKSKKEVFTYIRDRIWDRVKGWNERVLSKAGKEILIKAVLQAIPTYAMGCFKLPKTFLKELESLIANFWWNNKGSRKMHWMKWSDLCDSKGSGGMGFRNLEAFNEAILAKQGWRLIQNPTSLLSRMFKARYFKNCDFLEAPLGSNPSYTWRSIYGSRYILEAGLRWRIGNGRKAKIWDSIWIPNQRLSRICSLPVLLHKDSKVCDLIVEDTNCWNRELISQLFWEEVANLILRIPLGNNVNEDRLIWHYHQSGTFTVRSAYHLAYQLNHEKEAAVSGSTSSSQQKNWKWIWNMKVPSKVRIFIWRAIRNILPVTANLVKRRIIANGFCPVCQHEDETEIHCLFQCPLARQFWALSKLPWSTYAAQNESIEDWFESVRKKTDDEEMCLFGTACWTLWSNRNKIRVGEDIRMPHNLWRSVHYFLHSYREANAIMQPWRQPITSGDIKWEPPPPNGIKVNFDGAVSHDLNISGVGVIARSDSGECIAWCSKSVHPALSPDVIEVIAAKSAVDVALDKGWSDVILEGDCKEVIDKIKSGSVFFGNIGVILDDIKRAISSFTSFRASHVSRTCNEAAHSLARVALDPYFNFVDFPSSTKNIVIAESS